MEEVEYLVIFWVFLNMLEGDIGYVVIIYDVIWFCGVMVGMCLGFMFIDVE